jgi:hypothetical protein
LKKPIANLGELAIIIAMSKTRLAFVILIVLAVGLSWRITNAQPVNEQYFNETGHWVRGEFLLAYYSTPYHEEVYGQPISRFFQKSDNLWVQYFEKAIFELHLDNHSGQRVEIAPLGEILHTQFAGTPVTENVSGCQVYAETGFEVCQAFLVYFETRGGVKQFGNPVSGQESLNGITVQYFQKARLEYRPEFPAGKRVIVSDLGLMWFHYIRENRVFLLPEPGDATIEGPVRIKARAHPSDAITKLTGNQIVHVIVQDQRLIPVAGVRVDLEIRMPNGESVPGVLPAVTDENGIAVFEFSFATIKPGVVEIFAHVEKEALNTRTTTSFRTWW